MAYPNLFVVIVLGQLLGFAELTQSATWFLLPMFLLSPLDVRIFRSFESTCRGDLLRSYLGIQRPVFYSSMPQASASADQADSIPYGQAGFISRIA